VLAVAVLAAPAGRRRRGLEELDPDDELLTTKERFVPVVAA
jgi:hypothetical protein